MSSLTTDATTLSKALWPSLKQLVEAELRKDMMERVQPLIEAEIKERLSGFNVRALKMMDKAVLQMEIDID